MPGMFPQNESMFDMLGFLTFFISDKLKQVSVTFEQIYDPFWDDWIPQRNLFDNLIRFF